jgi:hypothetical protein
MTNMRDEIENILWDNRQNNGIDVVYIADAILAALPDMIAPLVWKEDKTLYEVYVVHLDGRSYLVEWGFYGWASTYYVSGQLQPVDLGQRHPTRDQAQAAVDNHHRAAFKAILTGATSK